MLGNYLSGNRNVLILTLAALCGAFFHPCRVRADEPVTQLEAVTVTAERFPVKEKESPRFITAASSGELKETGANNLSDALQRIGGFSYRALAPMGISHGGMNSTVSIRGVKDGELVLVNGVPVQGVAGHAYDLNTIPVEQIERVEILKGAASTLYGADAMSGVINIITKKTGKEKSVAVAVEFGNESFHHHRVSAALPGITAGFAYQRLGRQEEISRSFSKKYRYDIDDTDLYSWNLNANPFNNVYLDWLGSHYETGFEKWYDKPATPFEGTDQEHTKNFADLRYETEALRIKAFGNYEQMRRRLYTTPDDPEDKNRNYAGGLSGDHRFDLSGWEFTSGADWVYRGANYTNQYGEHHRNDYALFVQVKKTFFDRLTATIGAREQFIDGEPGTDDYDRFLPSLGLSWKLSDSLNLFANAGKAFRAPTFNNLYYESSFLAGNPDLGPEEGWTYESGMKYDTDLIRLRLSLFFMEYTDKIEIDRSRGYPQTYFNAGDYQSAGVEWEAGLTPFTSRTGWFRDLCFYASGYRADPVAEDADGEEYQAGPKLQTTLGIKYLSDALTLDVNSQILTLRERNLDSAAVINVHSRYPVWKGWITLAVDNLLDEEVQVSGDMSENASNQYLYYEIGRLVKVGYEITF